jgi:predicted Zn-dependent protease
VPELTLLARLPLAAALLVLATSLAPGQRLGAQPLPAPASALPALGEGVELPLATERRLGDKIAASIYRDEAYLDDPVLGDYLQAVWQPLMAAARARGELSPELEERFAWKLFLVRDRSVNAFALPGGYLGVHTGLLATVSTPDELAAVLGHELSHVSQRHIARLFTQQQKQAPWVMAAMILGVMAAARSTNGGNLGNAAMVGGQALAMQGQLNFSRDMEREADRVGFNVLTEAGFSPEGVSGMFEKLQQANRFNDTGAFPYLRSHPLTTERIAEARARVQHSGHSHAQVQRPDAGLPSLAWHAMMAGRARALGQPGFEALQARLNEARQLPTAATAAQSLSVLYAAAWSAARLREVATAQLYLERLSRLAAAQPQTARAAQQLAVEVELMLGRPSEAAAAAVRLQPSSRAGLMLQSQALLAAGRGAEVVDALQSWISRQPGDALAWQLLAQGLEQQGQAARAVRADAESRAVQFDYSGAVDRLRAAQELLRQGRGVPAAANQHIEASIIDTRLRQLQALAREQAIEDRLNR